jgi:ADP-L-glycero-D-manno-heptose 6-epimerase
MTSSRRILVTGGVGFIGSAVVWGLNKRGITDIVITDFLLPSEASAKAGPADAAKMRNVAGLKYSRLVDAGDFRAAIKQNPDAHGEFSHVFHLGACSSTTETNEAYLYDNNFMVTRELAEWAMGRGTKFVYASSAATYGDGSNGMSDTADITHLKPLNAYARSKQMFDLHARDHGWFDRIIGLKYFNVFGPNEDHKGDMRSLVNKAYHEVMRTGKITLFKSHRPDYADGEQKRDFLYVKDAVEMTLHLGFNEVPGGLYNLGSGEANSWNTLARAIFAALDREPSIVYIPMPEVLRERYQYFTQADVVKLLSTGWVQFPSSITEAVRDYLRSYLSTDHRLGSLSKT